MIESAGPGDIKPYSSEGLTDFLLPCIEEALYRRKAFITLGARRRVEVMVGIAMRANRPSAKLITASIEATEATTTKTT